MTGKRFSTEVHRRVYDEEEGHFITVRPDTDVPECVLLMTEDGEQEYWGNLRLTMQSAMARELGAALIAAANEAEKQ